MRGGFGQAAEVGNTHEDVRGFAPVGDDDGGVVGGFLYFAGVLVEIAAADGGHGRLLVVCRDVTTTRRGYQWRSSACRFSSSSQSAYACSIARRWSR